MLISFWNTLAKFYSHFEEMFGISRLRRLLKIEFLVKIALNILQSISAAAQLMSFNCTSLFSSLFRTVTERWSSTIKVNELKGANSVEAENKFPTKE